MRLNLGTVKEEERKRSSTCHRCGGNRFILALESMMKDQKKTRERDQPAGWLRILGAAPFGSQPVVFADDAQKVNSLPGRISSLKVWNKRQSQAPAVSKNCEDLYHA